MKYFFDANHLKPLERNHLNVSRFDGRIQLTNLYIEEDGKPRTYVSGEFHYSRYSSEQWEDEILKMKAGGIDVIATYCFWIHHEYKKGQWNFSGDMDLKKFIALCAKHEMKVLLRVGPYCHGEVLLGGMPAYAFFNPHRRSNHPSYMSIVRTLYTKYYEQVKDYLYCNGGNIIAVQLENEFSKQPDHLVKLKELAVEIGFRLPIYTITAWSSDLPDSEFLALSGVYPEAPWTQNKKPLPNANRFKIKPVYIDSAVGNDSHTIEDASAKKNERIIERMPLGMCEQGCGVQVVAHRRPIISSMDVYSLAFISLAKGITLLGYYMYHGGRNPNFAALQESKWTLYPNNLPLLSYDFQAPLGEYGYPLESFYYLRLLHYFVQHFDDKFPSMQAVFLPDSHFAQEQDTFSASVRMNEAMEGYCFLNTYERGVTNNGVTDAVMQVQQDKLELELPPLSLPNGQCFFYPFNLKLGTQCIEYITAQPILRFRKGNEMWYYFAKHPAVDVQLKVQGDAVQTALSCKGEVYQTEQDGTLHRLFVYEWKDCLNMHFLRQKQNPIYLSHNDFLYENGDDVIAIQEEKEKDLSAMVRLSPIKNRAMSQDRWLYGSHKPQCYALSISPSIFEQCYDAKLTFSGCCNLAHIYCEGKVVADYINYNNDFSVCLLRMKEQILAGKTFYIKTTAIKKNQATYFEADLQRDCSDIAVARVTPILRHKVEIKA